MGLFLGKDEVAVEFNLEDAPSGFNEFGFRIEFFFQVVRQTGGAGLVVSHSAIGDFETHSDISFSCKVYGQLGGSVPLDPLRPDPAPGSDLGLHLFPSQSCALIVPGFF